MAELGVPAEITFSIKKGGNLFEVRLDLKVSGGCLRSTFDAPKTALKGMQGL